MESSAATQVSSSEHETSEEVLFYAYVAVVKDAVDRGIPYKECAEIVSKAPGYVRMQPAFKTVLWEETDYTIVTDALITGGLDSNCTSTFIKNDQVTTYAEEFVKAGKTVKVFGTLCNTYPRAHNGVSYWASEQFIPEICPDPISDEDLDLAVRLEDLKPSTIKNPKFCLYISEDSSDLLFLINEWTKIKDSENSAVLQCMSQIPDWEARENNFCKDGNELEMAISESKSNGSGIVWGGPQSQRMQHDNLSYAGVVIAPDGLHPLFKLKAQASGCHIVEGRDGLHARVVEAINSDPAAVPDLSAFDIQNRVKVMLDE